MHFFWIAKYANWSGPTGAGTKESPFRGALALRTAIETGVIPAGGGHVITFMRQFGPVNRQELTEDWPNTLKTISQPLTPPPWSGDSCHAQPNQGGILIGDKRNHTSKCVDNLFLFSGDGEFDIDARGGTTNASRTRAAFMAQGTGNLVMGIKVAQPDFCYINIAGENGQIPATGITYAAEGSYENHGVVMWGGFGCGVTHSRVWGSDSFGNIGIQLNYMGIDKAANTGKPSFVQYNEVWGQYRGIDAASNGGAAGAEAQPLRAALPAGSPLDIAYNTVGGCRWGDRLATPSANNAMYHAGHISINSLNAIFADISVHHNDTSGWCQDSIECICVGVDVFDNHVHDLIPGYRPNIDNFNYWTASGATWVQTTYPATGAGIKLGLGSYEGTVGSAGFPDVWPNVGTSGGGFLVPALWNKAYRNRIHGNIGNGITSNGSQGVLVHANEVYDCRIALSLSGSAAEYATFWISHNYLKGNLSEMRSISTGVDVLMYLYNNICDSPNPGYAYSFTGAATGKGYGANNVFNGLTSGSGLMTALTGTITAAPDYTIGVGPTPGGNCAAGGARVAQRRGAFSALMFDIDGNPWNPGALPIGPRQVQ